MPFTTVTAHKILNKILRNTNFDQAAALYVSLHTGDPAEDGANECTGGGYIRLAVTFTAPAAKVCDNTAVLEFVNMPACTVTHAGLWSAESAGDFWWGGSLTASKVLGAGDELKVSTGDLDVKLDPA